MAKKLLYLISFLFSILSFSQVNIDDSLAVYNPQKAISEWTNSYDEAKTDKEKALVLIHTALALQIVKDYSNSVIFLEKAEKQINKISDPYFKGVFFSRMAIIYSRENYYFKAKQLAGQSLAESDLIKNTDDSYYVKAYSYYALYMTEHGERNFVEAIRIAPYCFNNFEKMSVESQTQYARFLMYALVNVSDGYMKTGQFDQAEQLELKAAELLKKNKNESLKITNFANLMETNVYLKQIDKAISYGHDALEIMHDKSYYLANRDFVYNMLLECYKQKGDLQNLKKYQLLAQENKKRLLIDQKQSLARNKEIIIPQRNSLKTYYIIGFVCLLLLGLIGFYWKKTSEKSSKEEPVTLLDDATPKENKTLIIPLNTEQELLRKLETFEQSKKFLNPKISIAMLAGSLDTNIQYLSQIINKNKNRNFNSYINHLRIKHLVSELQTNKEIRSYKISYLAKMIGFDSHSTFSKIFKQEIGSLPSEYIKMLDNNPSDK